MRFRRQHGNARLDPFLATLRRAAAGPATAVYAQARPDDAGVPYGALLRLVKALRDAQGAPSDAIDLPGPQTWPAGIEKLLSAAAGQGRTTLLLDDLHFADRASIEMLRAIRHAPAGSPCRRWPRPTWPS
jgi:hypothetical protein